jgi:hypothetical protein
MKTLAARNIPAAAAKAAAAVVGFALLNRAAPPVPTSTTVPATTSAAPQIVAAAPQTAAATLPTVADAPAVAATVDADPPPQKKTLLDKLVPGIRAEKLIAADSVIELLQDSASVTITVDWEKLGARGDKGVTLDLKPMPLRDMINGILKAAGARKLAKMTVEGTKVHVTAAPDKAKEKK